MTLRPAGRQDTEPLFQLYASTREAELAGLPWDATAREAFLRSQFTAQDRYYRSRFPDATYSLVVGGGDEILGRLYVDRGEPAWQVLDLSLLPQHRGMGIGGRLLAAVLAEASAAGRPVRLHVERSNPAQRLYARLGFRLIADEGVYLLLESAGGPA